MRSVKEEARNEIEVQQNAQVTGGIRNSNPQRTAGKATWALKDDKLEVTYGI